MRLVLLHYHILKNGGSTIEEILRRSFRETFAAFDLVRQDDEIKTAELIRFLEENPHVNAVSSHQIFYPVPRAPGFLFFDICFLRDPIDRIRSIYDYFRGRPSGGDPIRELANLNSPGDFTRRLVEEMPWAVNDVQVNLLANGIVNDQPRGAQDLEIAIARMLETSFLGVVDRFNESLVAAQQLNAVFPGLNCAQAPVNDTARPGSTLAGRMQEFRAACGEDVYAELLRLNAMDLKLLERARAEVRTRFERIPAHEERLRELKEAIAILQGSAPRASAAAPKIAEKRKPRAAPSPSAPPVFTRFVRRLRFAANLRNSAFGQLFDADYYREIYPDLAGVDPLLHFVTIGAFEGRKPHPLFDTAFYLRQRTPAGNALSDYLDHAGTSVKPHPLFDPEFYLRRYPDVRGSGMNPLAHYVLHGAAEGRKPHPYFQPEYYLTLCEDARAASNPLAYFAETEGAECCNPHPLFNGAAYLAEHPDASGNLLADFLARPEALRAGSPPAMEAASIAIADVDLVIGFPGPAFDSLPGSEQQRIYHSSGAILMWRDASGRKKFLCAPQQRPFFECARYDQLAAYINGTL